LDQLRRVSHDGTSYTWSNSDMRSVVDEIDRLTALLNTRPAPQGQGEAGGGTNTRNSVPASGEPGAGREGGVKRG
jgi:hypothetical protein